MSKIGEAINQLESTLKAKLFYAFEQGIPEYIIYNTNQFIGVNLTELPNLIIEETNGLWCIGRIK